MQNTKTYLTLWIRTWFSQDHWKICTHIIMSLKRVCRTHLSWIATVWKVTHLQNYSRTCFGLTNASLWHRQRKTGSVRAKKPSQLLLGPRHICFFWHCPGCSWTYISQAGLKLIPLPHASECWISAMEHTSSFKICISLLLNSGLVRSLHHLSN